MKHTLWQIHRFVCIAVALLPAEAAVIGSWCEVKSDCDEGLVCSNNICLDPAGAAQQQRALAEIAAQRAADETKSTATAARATQTARAETPRLRLVSLKRVSQWTISFAGVTVGPIKAGPGEELIVVQLASSQEGRAAAFVASPTLTTATGQKFDAVPMMAVLSSEPPPLEYAFKVPKGTIPTSLTASVGSNAITVPLQAKRQSR